MCTSICLARIVNAPIPASIKPGEWTTASGEKGRQAGYRMGTNGVNLSPLPQAAEQKHTENTAGFRCITPVFLSGLQQISNLDRAGDESIWYSEIQE